MTIGVDHWRPNAVEREAAASLRNDLSLRPPCVTLWERSQMAAQVLAYMRDLLKRHGPATAPPGDGVTLGKLIVLTIQHGSLASLADFADATVAIRDEAELLRRRPNLEADLDRAEAALDELHIILNRALDE